MLDREQREKLHRAALRFLSSGEGGRYIERIYFRPELPPDQLVDYVRVHRESFVNAVVEEGMIWMINSTVTEGGEFSGAALLIAGAKGTEKSEKFVSHICEKLTNEDWGDLPKKTIKTIQKQLADDVFHPGRLRKLPPEFTNDYPVLLFDAVVGRDSINKHGTTMCLVNPKSEFKIFPIPATVFRACGIKMPGGFLDDSEKLLDDSHAVKAELEDIVYAKEKARSSVMFLLDRVVTGELEGFSVKVALPGEDGETEHMWLAGVQYEEESETFSGYIEEAPEEVAGYEAGQRFRVAPGSIIDWLYYEDEKMHGNFTIRTVLDSIPLEQADHYRAILADLD